MVERIRSTLGGEFGASGPPRDDAAVIAGPGPGGSLVLSIDSVVQGVHFDLALSTLHDVGWTALMSALSDVAAMGAAPVGALVALCVPDLRQGDKGALGVLEGVAEASAASGCPVLGGDVSEASELSVVVTVLGSPEGGSAVPRSGARPNDLLFLTGPCGASAAGLRLLRQGERLGPAVARHLRPVARLAEGQTARRAGAHAMIDVSDGLALDLHRLADASGVGFALDEVPVADGATLDEALGGGEDYELLLAVGPDEVIALGQAFAAAGLTPPLQAGGRATAGAGGADAGRSCAGPAGLAARGSAPPAG